MSALMPDFPISVGTIDVTADAVLPADVSAFHDSSARLPIAKRTRDRAMQISLISARELTDDLLIRWSDIQSGSPALASPYFSPEFTRAVADVREDVEVALIHDGAS